MFENQTDNTFLIQYFLGRHKRGAMCLEGDFPVIVVVILVDDIRSACRRSHTTSQLGPTPIKDLVLYGVGDQ